MMTFHLRLKRISKPKNNNNNNNNNKKTTKKPTRLKFDHVKLKDPNVLETLKAIIVGKFAPSTIMDNEDTEVDSMITTFNTAVIETASEILSKHRQKKRKKNLGHCRNP